MNIQLIYFPGVERSDSPLQKWQDKIDSGFNKLVAFASEVDKRRKSTEGASPRQEGLQSPLRASRDHLQPPLPLPPPDPHHHLHHNIGGGISKHRGGRGDDEGKEPPPGVAPTPYSPHSPSHLTPSPVLPGRPPTPQSPRGVGTPPLSSPPPTPSPDHCRPGSPPPPGLYSRGGDSPPYLPSDLETTRLVLPPGLTSPPGGVHPSHHRADQYDHHHFKKKFYKERLSPPAQGHGGDHQGVGKFRPKGKDWQWRSRHAPPRSPPGPHGYSHNYHNNNNNSHHSHHRPPGGYQHPPVGPPMRHQQLLAVAPPVSRAQNLSPHPMPAGYYSHQPCE